MPSLPIKTYEYYDNSGGIDLKSSPTKVSEIDCTATQNMDYDTDGAFFSRNGHFLVNQGHQLISGGSPAKGRAMYDYRKSNGLVRQIIAAGTDLYEDLESPTAFAGLPITITVDNFPDFEFFVTNDDEYLIWGNGVDANMKYNGTSWTLLSIVAPATPLTATIGGAAAGMPAGNYDYIVVYVRQQGGVVQQRSDNSGASTPVVVNAGNLQVDLTNIPISPDSQVNGREIYRRISTGANEYRLLTLITDNTTTVFTDNITTESSALNVISLDNQPSPISAIFESYSNRMFYVDFRPTGKKEDLYYSLPGEPWAVPTENFVIFDGPISNLVRCYGVLLISTDKSLWVWEGDPDTNSPRRISSRIGVVNNRCATGEGSVYLFTNNQKVYDLTPTDFANDEIRIDNPLSRKIDPILGNINPLALDEVKMWDYTKGNVSKILFALPLVNSQASQLWIFNETQSIIKQSPCWHYWEGLDVACFGEFTTNGESFVYAITYDGYIWRLDNDGLDGDGAEINGTATSGTTTTIVDLRASGTATAGGASTLTDGGASFTINEFTGDWITLTGGTGAGQSRQISSNTATVITVSTVWVTVPDATTTYQIGPFEPNVHAGKKVLIVGGTNEDQKRQLTANTNIQLTTDAFPTAIDNTSQYSLGGYDKFHFTNWKSVTGSYDTLKQLWFFLYNLNSYGIYTIDLIIQTDFDTSYSNADIIPINLNLNNAIWGLVVWLDFIWGASAVFTNRIRHFDRFRSIRFGFRNRIAGQPFQINTFSVSAQDKSYFYPANP